MNKPLCDHKRTEVKSSRAPDFIRQDGKPAYGPILYPCMVVRRRYCLECGERITTVEVPKDFMDSIDPEKVRNEILTQIHMFLLHNANANESVTQ